MSENGPGEPEGSANLPAQAGQERLSEPIARHGMFGASTSGDTSGYGGCWSGSRPRCPPPARTARTSTS